MSAPEPRLEVADPDGCRLVPLGKPRFTIGRKSSNDLSLSERDVSRDHAEITHQDGRHVIRDRGSRCGTFVNGLRVTEQPLAHGDRIRLGQSGGVELRFLVEADANDSQAGSSVGGGLRQIAAVLNSLRQLGGARVLEEVLALVLDAAIEVTGAERGFVMLANEAGRLEPKLARGQGGVPLSGPFPVSKITEQVFVTGREQIVQDLPEVDLEQTHDKTRAYGIRHVVCIPLRLVHVVDHPDAIRDSRSIGVLYLDSRASSARRGAR
jgi:pSer/pThr/pTyr-binding forkhead associated (FHA) protein